MKHRRISSVVAVVVLGLLAAAETPAFAATGDAGYESGPIVRRQLLFRSGRLEVQPMVAFTLNDAFIRNGMGGVNATLHLNNVFGIGGTFNYGLMQMDTSLRENVQQTLEARAPNQLRNLSYSYINWAADVGLTYVPIFGKFSIFNSMITHYDIHLIGGLAIVNEAAIAAGGGEPDAGLSGTRPGGMIGAGVRLFIGEMFSLNFEARDYIYNRAQVSDGAATLQLSNNVVMSFGVGIFFPGNVKISR